MRKTKAKLIFTLSVALLAVFTMGVSTFAWFQANANVSIDTTSDSCTITATKPENTYTFYAYKYNNDAAHYGDVTNNGSNTAAFETDFTAVTNLNKTALTSSSGLNPGESLTFAVKITAARVDNPITLNITSLISNTAIKQGESYHRYSVENANADTGEEINVGWAMDIYSMGNDDGTGYESFLTATNLTDKFNYSKNALGDLNNAGTGTAPNKVIDLEEGHEIKIYNADATATTMYVFYRLYYSNATSTFFKEINAKGDNVEVTNANRRFLYTGNNTGTSNCYGGLKFQLTTIDMAY